MADRLTDRKSSTILTQSTSTGRTTTNTAVTVNTGSTEFNFGQELSLFIKICIRVWRSILVLGKTYEL